MAKKDLIKEPKDQKPPIGAPKKTDKPEDKFAGAPAHSILTGWLQYAKTAAQKKHWEMFVIDQFVKGNHNVRGNPSDNTITVSKRTESINYPINKIYAVFRAVRAFVTRHKPVAEVDPENSTEEAKTYARRANIVLERDNQLNNGRRLNKEWAYYGVKYGIGWRQVGFDTVKKCAIRWTIDPFDLLIGAKSGKTEDAPYVIKSVVRTIGYWKNKYPDANVAPDNEIAEDEYKRLAFQIQFQDTSSSGQPTDEQTAIGYECWYRVFEKNKAGGLVNKCLFTKSGIVDFEETPYDEYPFIPYEAEILPNELYPDGHLKHVIAPQRMLDLLNTQMLEYNHIVNRGRIIKDKNSGFRVINAKEGQIIEKNPGKQVTFTNPPGVNPILGKQLDLSLSFIEDIGGQHDASTGGTPPPGITSGVAIEQLQQGDSNNISDLRDNFEDALSLEAAWILKVYSLFQPDALILNESVNGKDQQFAVVGKGAYDAMNKKVPDKYLMEDNGTYCDTVAILPNNHVKVSVTSQLGETRAAKLDLLTKLVDLGLPLKYLLENLEFPNTNDIFERIASESLAELMMQNMKGAPNGATPPGAGGDPNAPVDNSPEAQMTNNLDGQSVEQLLNLRNRLSGQNG